MTEPKRRVPSSDTVDTFLSNTNEAIEPMMDTPPNAPVKARKLMAGLTNRKQQILRRRHPNLLANYFNVQQVNSPQKAEKVLKVILPGVPKYDEDWARDLHDFFNLTFLVPVLILNALNWNWEILLQNLHRGHVLEKLPKAWTGDYFELFFYGTALYFCVDILWIVIYPHCVKSPSVILQHHLAVLVYIIIPYNYKAAQWCMGACMTVECNTWFLIARRVFNKQGFPPWTIYNGSWLSIRVKVISIFFYLTWISIRCVLYPSLLWTFYDTWMALSRSSGTYFNILLPSVPLHACFCLLNLKWTYELTMSKIRYFRRRKQFGDIDTSVSKGL